jgi:DNA polymerase-3 subunit delta
LQQWLEEIRGGRPRPAYLCVGEEFLAEQAARELIEALLPAEARGTNLERFSGDALDPAHLLGSLRTRPLFGGRKVVAVFGATFLASRESAKDILSAAHQAWGEGDREKGARLFLRALGAAGIEQEVFADPAWKDRLSSEPEKVLPGVEGDLLKWVSVVRGHCLQEALVIPKLSNLGDALEAELARGFPPGMVLVLAAPAADQRRRLFKALETSGGVLELAVPLRQGDTRPPDDVLKKELQARATAAGKRITDEARDAILQRAGSSLRGFAEELEKLFMFVGDRPIVEIQDVDAAFGDRAEAHVFHLTDALGERNLGRALAVLNALLGQGEEPLYLLNILAGAVRGLIPAREVLDGPLAERWEPNLSYGAFQGRVWEPAKASLAASHPDLVAMHPFRAYRVMAAASRFTLDELTEAMERLFETDLQMKSTGIDPARLLELLLFDLCGPRERAPAL